MGILGMGNGRILANFRPNQHHGFRMKLKHTLSHLERLLLRAGDDLQPEAADA